VVDGAGCLGLRLTNVFRWGFGFVCAALRWAGKLLSKTRPISASMPKIVVPPSISASLRFLRGLDGRCSCRFPCWQACNVDGLGVFRRDNLDSVSHRESKGSLVVMAKASKRIVRRAWTTQDEKELKKHSKSKTSVRAISRRMRRTPGALRQKARQLGFSIGHQPRRRTRRR
jgi:hypothetical protein